MMIKITPHKLSNFPHLIWRSVAYILACSPLLSVASDELNLHCMLTFSETTHLTYGGPPRRRDINEEVSITIFMGAQPQCVGGYMDLFCRMTPTEIRSDFHNPDGPFGDSRTTVTISRVTGAYEFYQEITSESFTRYSKKTGVCRKPQQQF